AQVTVFEQFEQSPLWSALRFLWGRGSTGELFDLKLCQVSCEAGVTGDRILELTPRQPLATVQRALLAIEPTTHRVRAARVYDALGNRTDYAFSAFHFGLKLGGERFHFEIPDGVSVLRPVADAPAKPAAPQVK
ncbi:MAG: hypothetical protein AAB426_06635, partial [Myxococcota bacterium]